MSGYPVMVRGEIFPSATACAERFGISRRTVYRAVALGRTNTLGLGTDHNRKPCWIDGTEFPSQLAAAKALATHPMTFYSYCREVREAGRTEFKWKGHNVRITP